MRRSVIVAALIAACALVAAPASAQVQNHNWFANAAVGPSFGTLGSTPVVDASAGYTVTPHVSVGGEARFDAHAVQSRYESGRERRRRYHVPADNWLGLNADYRHFVVNASDTQHVNRFTTGVSVLVK
jgi:hypothetical protein